MIFVKEFGKTNQNSITVPRANKSNKIGVESISDWILVQEIPQNNIFFWSMVYYMVRWWPKYDLSDNIEELIAHFKGQHSKLYCKETELRLSAKFVADKIEDNPLWALKQLNVIEKLSASFFINSTKLSKMRLSNKTQVLRQFNKTNKLFLESQVLGAGFTWLTEAKYELVTKKVISVIETKIKEKNIDENVLAVFNLLTSSDEKSFVHRKEQDLFRLAKTIQNNAKFKTLFLQMDVSQLTALVESDGNAVCSAIKKFNRKWCWISYGYVGPETKLSEDLAELKNAYWVGVIFVQIRKNCLLKNPNCVQTKESA